MPKLMSLSPTSEAFAENVKRAHFQAFIWKAALSEDPPHLDATEFGWSRDNTTRSLIPLMLPSDMAPAPPEILEIIRYGCASERPREKARCGCHKAQLSCTVFCSCYSTDSCHNS